MEKQPLSQQRFSLQCSQHEICSTPIPTKKTLTSNLNTTEPYPEDSDAVLIFDDDVSTETHSISSKLLSLKQKQKLKPSPAQQKSNNSTNPQTTTAPTEEESSTHGLSHITKQFKLNQRANSTTTTDPKTSQAQEEESTCADQDSFEYDANHLNDIEIDPSMKKNSTNRAYSYNKVTSNALIEQCCSCQDMENLKLSHTSATTKVMKSTLHMKRDLSQIK